jgi:hypothetical protein
MLRIRCQGTPAHSALRFSRSGSSCEGHAPRPQTRLLRSAKSTRSQLTSSKETPMPFQQRGEVPLNAVVNVRLTAAEKARLLEDADLAALTMSQLIRRRYFGRPIIANADMVMLKELRRLGGLLKHIHNESGGIYSRETAGALVALRAYIEVLSHDRQKS